MSRVGLKTYRTAASGILRFPLSLRATVGGEAISHEGGCYPLKRKMSCSIDERFAAGSNLPRGRVLSAEGESVSVGRRPAALGTAAPSQ